MIRLVASAALALALLGKVAPQIADLSRDFHSIGVSLSAATQPHRSHGLTVVVVSR